MLKKFLMAVLAVLLAASLCPARTIEGVDLPETMEVGGKTVALNGGGVRKSMYLKTYVGGLYVQEAVTEAAAVISADKPMAIRLHMIEDVGQETMKTACYNGFRGATGDNIEPIESRIDQFMGAFSDPIKKGDIFDFKYMPGQGTKIYKQGKLLSTIEGLDFKKAMFGIWFSDQPADKTLKENMLAGDIRVSPEKQQPEKKTAVASAEAAAEEKAEEAAKQKAAAQKAAAEKAAAEKAAAEKAAAEKAAAEKAAAEKAAAKRAAAEKAEAERLAAAKAKAEKAAAEKAAAEARQQKMQADVSAAQSGAKASAESAAAAGAATAAAGATAAEDKQAAGEKEAMQAKAKPVPKKTTDKPEKVKSAVVEPKSPPKASAKTAEKKAGQKTEGKSADSVTWAQVAGEDIYFEVNDASLTDQAIDRLARKVKWMKANPEASVIVEVYCDPRGSENYNKWLAHKRGRSVKTYLVNEGIAPSRVRVKVRGENDQKYRGKENWEKNRRAHFKVRN